MIGVAAAHTGQQGLARDMADHLRALLRDVICGHLDPNLVGLADQLLLADAHEAADAHEEVEAHDARQADQTAPEQASVEELLGDPRQAQEILDVFI